LCDRGTVTVTVTADTRKRIAFSKGVTPGEHRNFPTCVTPFILNDRYFSKGHDLRPAWREPVTERKLKISVVQFGKGCHNNNSILMADPDAKHCN